jgi:hypothetical protein
MLVGVRHEPAPMRVWSHCSLSQFASRNPSVRQWKSSLQVMRSRLDVVAACIESGDGARKFSGKSATAKTRS